MKRQLNGAPTTSKKRAKAHKTRPDETSESPLAIQEKALAEKPSNWTQEEDQFLQNLVGTGKNSWLNVCKKINKNFKKPKRTIKECQERFRVISKERDMQPWSVNEELIFLCILYLYGGQWEGHVDGIIKRSTKNVRDHLEEQIKGVLCRIREGREDEFRELNSMNQLAIYVYLALFFANFGTKGDCPEIIEELARSGVSEKDCEEYIKKLGVETKEMLLTYVDNVMERLQNKMLEKAPPIEENEADSLAELFHQRVEENRGRRQDIYLHILSPAVTGHDQYLISIYFLPNN